MFIQTKYKYWALFFIAMCLTITSSQNSYAEQYLAHKHTKTTEQTRELSFRGLKNNKLRGTLLRNVSELREYYSRSDIDLIWLKKDPIRLEQVITLYENSWTHGLNPSDYHATTLKNLIDNSSESKRNSAKLELLFSDAAIQYYKDMEGRGYSELSVQGEHFVSSEQDFNYSIVLDLLNNIENPAYFLYKLKPQTELYTALRQELIHLAKTNRQNDYLLPLDFGKTLFEPGDSHRDVINLRQILGHEDLDSLDEPEIYAGSLVDSVKMFQESHNLHADGIIGPKTLSLLNRSKYDKMQQIVVNMERLRSLNIQAEGRHIVVNIPSQTLWAIDSSDIMHTMDVIVGSPHRRTTEFKTHITGLRVNPNWTVPLNIKMLDMLPKLQQDPYALEQKNIDLIRGYGRNAEYIDPANIDWHSVSRRDMSKIRMVQSPGDHNALGRFRVLMPNAYNIYLHDTNQKHLFDRGDRTLSSGCIRLSDPATIADFILNRHENWSSETKQALLETQKTTDIKIQDPFPVFIVYQTIWLNDEGKLVYGPDVYKKDKKTLQNMTSDHAFALPEPSKTRIVQAQNL